MSGLILYSIIETPFHPDLSAVYKEFGLAEIRFNSMRKAIAGLKQQLPDIIVADFIYGYGSNYAGANVSNLDVFLRSLEAYGKDSKIIVLVDKEEQAFVAKLHELFPLSMALLYPVKPIHMQTVLKELGC